MKRKTERDEQHYRRRRNVLAAARHAVLALLVAGCVIAGIDGSSVELGIGIVLFSASAVADLCLTIRETMAANAAALAALMSGRPCQARDADATHYGVDPAALPEGQAWTYVPRDFEGELREAIANALSSQGSRLVMLCGESKAGKTRAAFQTLKHQDFHDAWILVPRTGADAEKLIQPGALPRRWKQVAIWLDDIEDYAATLDHGALRNLQCDRPIVLLATEGGRGTKRYAGDSGLVDPVERLRAIATQIDVPVTPTAGERERTETTYGERFATETAELGLGRRMVAIEKLKRKLQLGHDEARHEPCREGVALIRAASDWRRTGAQSPISAAQLDTLYRRHLPNDLDPSPDLLDSAIRWAREPLPGTGISLLRKSTDGDRYTPYDLAVQIAGGIWPMPDEQTQQQIINIAGPDDCFDIGVAAHERDETARSIAAFRRAEASTDTKLAAYSTFNLGVFLERSGDTHGAEDAYRRADQHGLPEAAVNLGNLLRDRGDTQGAEEAFRRADQHGDAEAAHNLGVLLQQHGDTQGAEDAYRRADQRGLPEAAVNLGVLLERSGDTQGAEDSYRRADQRGDARAAHNLGVLLHDRGDTQGAEEAFRRADQRGDAEAAHNLGVLLQQRGDTQGAEEAFRRARERGLRQPEC